MQAIVLIRQLLELDDLTVEVMIPVADGWVEGVTNEPIKTATLYGNKNYVVLSD